MLGVSRLSRHALFDIKSTAAPAYRRVVIQRKRGSTSRTGDKADAFGAGAGYRFEDGLNRPAKGVNDGNGFCFISHTGDACPSGFLPLAAGNVRRQSMVDIYRHAALFRSLRDPGALKDAASSATYAEAAAPAPTLSRATTSPRIRPAPTARAWFGRRNDRRCLHD